LRIANAMSDCPFGQKEKGCRGMRQPLKFEEEKGQRAESTR
jgi:hypothetical protein